MFYHLKPAEGGAKAGYTGTVTVNESDGIKTLNNISASSILSYMALVTAVFALKAET
jgi:hypothetical protein